MHSFVSAIFMQRSDNVAEYYQYKNPNGSVSTYTKEQADAIKAANPNIQFSNTYATDTSGQTASAVLGSGGKTATQVQPQIPQQPQVPDNSAMIQQMFEQQKQAVLAQLKQSIAASKSKYQTQLSEAPDQYRNLRNTVSTNYYQSLPRLQEALANTGNLNSGMGRQEQLIANTAMQNDINALNTQQQQYENQINTAISDLERSGSQQELQIASENAANLLQALISEGNRVSQESYQRLQDALARSDKQTAFGAGLAGDTASAMGYVNPYAQYALTPDIQQALAPYANDYAAFIQANPNSWLVPYARNARFQKMLSNPSQFAGELEQFRTQDYEANQLRNALTQAQIGSTNALANQRSTPNNPSSADNPNTIRNQALSRASSEINQANRTRAASYEAPLSTEEEQSIINKWLSYYGVGSTGGGSYSEDELDALINGL